MSGVNRVILVGRLGADPEVRRMNSGDSVVNIRVATSETWRDKQTGDRKEKTEWHNVVIFNEHAAKFAEQYLHKGDMVFVEGQLQTRKWQDQQGQDRYTTEVVLQKFRGELQSLSSARNDGDSGGGERSGNQRSSSRGGYAEQSGGRGGSAQGSQRSFSSDMDDDIPFAPEWR